MSKWVFRLSSNAFPFATITANSFCISNNVKIWKHCVNCLKISSFIVGKIVFFAQCFNSRDNPWESKLRHVWVQMMLDLAVEVPHPPKVRTNASRSTTRHSSINLHRNRMWIDECSSKTWALRSRIWKTTAVLEKTWSATLVWQDQSWIRMYCTQKFQSTRDGLQLSTILTGFLLLFHRWYVRLLFLRLPFRSCDLSHMDSVLWHRSCFPWFLFVWILAE